jgi:glycosyltransferase involved in cell wall biosynthesis
VLSVVIPAYNERNTIGRCIVAVAAILPDTPKEIVVVDDGSTDGTREWLTRNLERLAEGAGRLSLDAAGELVGIVDPAIAATRLQLCFHAANRGKGGALQTGLAAATGDVIVIQDADLEYDPADWPHMYDLIAERQVADVVFGSRFYGRPHRALYFHHYLANRLISFLFNLLFDQTLSDIEVCTKMIRREVRDSLRLTCNDFGIEVEISAQIARARHWRIYETGICYYGRTYAEGKKIGWRDGVKALWYLLRFRFAA